MVRLTGFVTVGGRRAVLNWTITDTGIVEGVGLSADEVVVHQDVAPVIPLSTPTEPLVEPTEPTSYDDMNKTDLQVLSSQRGLIISGTKAEIIDRLNTADNTDVEEVVEESTEPLTEEGADNGKSESE